MFFITSFVVVMLTFNNVLHFVPGKADPSSSVLLVCSGGLSLSNLLYLGGAAGGGYAQVIPMEEVPHAHNIIAPRIKKASSHMSRQCHQGNILQ